LPHGIIAIQHKCTQALTQVLTQALTPASQAGTWLTYPWGMEGWV